MSGSSLDRSKFKVSFVAQFVRVSFSFWTMLSSLVCLICRGGWRFLVRMSVRLCCLECPLPLFSFPHSRNLDGLRGGGYRWIESGVHLPCSADLTCMCVACVNASSQNFSGSSPEMKRKDLIIHVRISMYSSTGFLLGS